MKKIIILFLLLLCTCNLTYSQNGPLSTHNRKAAKFYNEATSALYPDDAVELLKKAIAEDSNFLEAQAMLGYLYDDMEKDEEAIYHFSEALRINPTAFPHIYFDIGRLELGVGSYKSAQSHLQFFLQTGKGDDETTWAAKQMITDCQFAANALQHPVPFSPLNMGGSINTPLSEYFPTITVDGSTLLFTRRLQRGTQMPGEGDYNEDLYISFKQDNQWTRAINLGPQINTEYNEGASTLSADGSVLIFTSDRPGGYGSCDLYYALKTANGWGYPQNLGQPINTKNWETQPCLSSDGKSLYFIRGRMSGISVKDQDIYVSTLTDSSYWSNPVKLSDTINTPGKEECPFIAPDNQTLYFCSDGHPGMGGTDIFMSRRLPNGRWGISINLGYPINTSKDETGVCIDPNGKLAYFASDRAGGYGGLDIYSFALYDSIRPQPVTYMKGKVFNATTKDPLIAYFTLIDLATGKVVSQYTSKPADGSFLICLPSNKNYALNVSKKGYLFYSENFSLKNVKASYEHPFIKDVPLQPIDTGASIVLKNIFFETNKYDLKPESEVELNKLVSFLKNNSNIKIQISGHTDNQGTPQSNIILSENRAKSVYDYLTAHGIDTFRLTYKGYGQAVPVASNETPEGRAQNRRTEIKITGK